MDLLLDLEQMTRTAVDLPLASEVTTSDLEIW
jgi:hypothetical protein